MEHSSYTLRYWVVDLGCYKQIQRLKSYSASSCFPLRRHGWFVPAEAESLLPHWKLLTEAAVAATFRPQPAVLHTLEQELLNPGCVDTVLSSYQ